MRNPVEIKMDNMRTGSRKGPSYSPDGYAYGGETSKSVDIDAEVQNGEGCSQPKGRGVTRESLRLVHESSDSSSSEEDSADGSSSSDEESESVSENSTTSSEESDDEDEDPDYLELDKYKKTPKNKISENDADVVFYGTYGAGEENWDTVRKKYKLKEGNSLPELKSNNNSELEKKSDSVPKRKKSDLELNRESDSESCKKEKNQSDSDMKCKSDHSKSNKKIKSELNTESDSELQKKKHKSQSDSERKNKFDHSESNKYPSESELKKHKSDSEPKKEESEDKKKESEPIEEASRKRKSEKPQQGQRESKKSKSMKMAPKSYDYVDIIYNSDSNIDGKNDEEIDLKKSTTLVVNPLPLKFRFAEPEEPVKSEFDIEVENLFRELEFHKTCDQQKVDADDDEDALLNLVALVNKFQLCQMGKHELRLDEQIGEICIYCDHVGREIRDIMPEFIILTSDAPDRERYFHNERTGSIYDDSFHDSAKDSRRIEEKKGTVWENVPDIHRSMYPHQIEGFEFLWKNLAGTIQLDEIAEKNSNNIGGCIISHAPGTGKTRMTIAFISSYLKIFPECHPLVILPASMLLTWAEEFKKWKVEFPFYNLNNPELSGNENKSVLDYLSKSDLNPETRTRMAKIHSWDRNPGVLGISYNLYTKYLAGGEDENGIIEKKKNEFWAKTLLEKPGLVVLDEGHTPRAKGSVSFKILQKLQTRKRIILSGTPFQNNFEELENTLRIVQPDYADSLAKDSMFAEAKKRDSTIKKSKMWGNWLKRFNEDISPFVDVYKGSILQKTLPGLSKCKINLNPGKFQKKIIDKIITDSAHNLETECRDTLVTIHPSLILSCTLSKTQEALIHNDRGKLRDFKLDHAQGVKTKFIFRLVQLSLALNEKVLIFCQYRAPLNFIKDQLNHAFSWSEEKVVKLIYGSQSPKIRQKIINDFNDLESEAKVMLASTKCCKEGISLTGASRVVFLDVVWNPSVEKQAMSRAYRIGQKKMVYCYHLITATEENKHNLQAEKDRLSELVFQPKQNNLGIQTNRELIEDKILDAISSNFPGMFDSIIYQKNLPEDS